MRRRQVLPPQPRLRLGGRRRPTAAHVVGPSDQELGEDPQHLPQVSFDEPVIGLGYSSGSWFGLGAAAGHRDLFSSFVDLDQPLNPADHLDPVRTTRLHAYFRAVVASTSEPDLADRLARLTLSTGQTYAEVTTHLTVTDTPGQRRCGSHLAIKGADSPVHALAGVAQADSQLAAIRTSSWAAVAPLSSIRGPVR